MARKSGLSEKQWQEIEKRYLAGEGARPLGREYGISEAAIRKRFSARTKSIKEVAKQLATAEVAFSKLPIGAQISARTMADELKFMHENMLSSAAYSSMTSKLWSKAASDATTKIMFKAMDDDGETVNPERLAECAEEMAPVMKSIQLAKEASHIPLKAMEIAARDKPEPEEGRKIILVNAPED